MQCRNIFNVKSKEVVHECETEFGVFPGSKVIDRRKSKFLVKYDRSDITCYANCAKNVTKLFYTVSEFRV